MGDDKEHGRPASGIILIIVAVIGAFATLGAAIFPNWDKIFPPPLPTQTSSGSNAATATSGAHPPRPLIATLRTKGPLFIVVPPGAEGTSIGARILTELQVEGFRIANGPDDAKLLIEIQAPNLGLPQTSPVSGLDGFSVVATLTAKMFPKSDGSGDTVPMQRQALGVGATEIEARRNSIAAATDRLGKSIIDALR